MIWADLRAAVRFYRWLRVTRNAEFTGYSWLRVDFWPGVPTEVEVRRDVEATGRVHR